MKYKYYKSWKTEESDISRNEFYYYNSNKIVYNGNVFKLKDLDKYIDKWDRRILTEDARNFNDTERFNNREYEIEELGEYPIPLIEKLAQDKDGLVKSRIANHSKLPKNMIYKLSEDNHHIKYALVEHSKKRGYDLPKDIIFKLSKDSNSNVRWITLRCYANVLTPDILKDLTLDDDILLKYEIYKKVSNDKIKLPVSYIIYLGVIAISFKDRFSREGSYFDIYSYDIKEEDIIDAYDLIINNYKIKYYEKGVKKIQPEAIKSVFSSLYRLLEFKIIPILSLIAQNTVKR